ncbi:Tyrosine-protein phosphatase 10D [Melipona quadrifasciata]|uniref:protein-tyrosine-phosphatase n=1 Tax=Melipona quadrifasciata TaxID=166423 RepID=A0A0M9A3K5_9HYME|nr:Tyrosine-protein phosphatase 10D [Melipona quadrifasciata]
MMNLISGQWLHQTQEIYTPTRPCHTLVQVTYSADLAIEIPGNLSQGGSWYRLDYSPAVGYPPPNTTIAATDIGDVIKFKDGLPGTRYEFWLYYSNSTLHDWLTWTASITTAPDPPSNLTVSVRNGKTAIVYWAPPAQGNYSGFRLRVQSFSDTGNPKTSVIPADAVPYVLRDLIPGATYSLQLFTVNETTLLVLWQPPYPAGIYSHYKVSIDPPDAIESVLYVEKEGEPPGPAQAAFKGLVPGRAYNISVQTMSEDETSAPTTAQYRTVPLRPLNVTFDKSSITSTSFRVFWNPPEGVSEFDKYQISLGGNRRLAPVTRNRDDESKWEFKDLEPGKTYQVVVKTVSGKVTSWPANGDVTLKPLPVRDLRAVIDEKTGMVEVSWHPENSSTQDNYKLQYHEVETTIGVPHAPKNLSIEKVTSNTVVVHWEAPTDSLYSEFSIRYRTEDDPRWVKLPSVRETEAEVADMTPGERYTIQVNTVSYGVESLYPLQVNHTVRPNPVLNITPVIDSTNVTLEWPRPEGRIETYVIRWWPVENSEDIHAKNVTESNDVTSVLFEENTVQRVLISDLMPGVQYSFVLYTVSYNLFSDITNLTTRTMPLIQSEVVVVVDQDQPDSLTLRYTRTPVQSSKFDLYRFRISDESNTTKERMVDDIDTKVTFTGLTPGKLYNVTVWTVSDNVESRPLIRQDRLYPEPVTSIQAIEINDTRITLTWDIPRGQYDAFEVQYINTEENYIQNITSANLMTISDLKPHRNYTFTLVVRSGTASSYLRISNPVSASFTTSESYPGKVEKFHPTDIQPSDISFEWSLPSQEQNGIIRKYTITYGLEGSAHTQMQDFRPNEYRGVIKSLIPGKTYIFRIQAQTKIGFGPEAVWKQKMPILAPPKPSTQVVPTEVCRSSTTIQIRFRKNYFSEQNGAVTSYTVIVAEDDSKNASGLEMPSWRDVQAYSIWPPYQVMEPYYPFKNGSVEDFTIGSENCDNKIGYCNGPLKSGSTYKVKVRAFTAPDKFTDTSYSFPIQTDSSLLICYCVWKLAKFMPRYFVYMSAQGLLLADKDNTAIMVGVIVPIVFLLTLLGIGLLVRRRRSQGRKTTETRTTDNLSLPDSVIDTSRPIKIEDFSEHYRTMSADSDFRFSEEFEELKHVGRDQPCTAADLPCNRPKNRFTNILPYDHSRFKLQPVDDEEGSDYINANYVPCHLIVASSKKKNFKVCYVLHQGHNSPREFIVTQGPLHSTRDDFWRMVWESNSRAIVMLTRCIEKGREKCDHYWPMDTHPVYYGDICVTILNETHYPDWSITEFMLCRISLSKEQGIKTWAVIYVRLKLNLEENISQIDGRRNLQKRNNFVNETFLRQGDVKRIIQHFHFTTWPDFGVPNPPQTLARFVRAFREKVRPDQRPIVVHCSAGVGRSGTFITLDRILQQILVSKYVDIFGIVWAMRKERVWMVQTEQQYICIHQCLLAVLEGQDMTGPPREIHDNQGFEDDSFTFLMPNEILYTAHGFYINEVY